MKKQKQREISSDKAYINAVDYLPQNKEYDIDDTDDVVKGLIKSYEQLSSTGDVKNVLALKNIRLRHPLFQKLTLKAFQILMENSYMYKLKAGQFIYREGI